MGKQGPKPKFTDTPVRKNSIFHVYSLPGDRFNRCGMQLEFSSDTNMVASRMTMQEESVKQSLI